MKVRVTVIHRKTDIFEQVCVNLCVSRVRDKRAGTNTPDSDCGVVSGFTVEESFFCLQPYFYCLTV